MGEGAATGPAIKAYSGIFEDNLSTDEFDPDKRPEFWMWWLTEAIPGAWAAESAVDEPATETMPFRNTVRLTRYKTGVEVVFGKQPHDE